MEQEGFIHRVWDIIRRVQAETEMNGLRLRSRLLLDIIGEHHAEPLRVSDLVKVPQAGTPPTVYAALAELEHGEWICRVADPEDGRSFRLRLTPKARRAYARMSREIARTRAL